MMNMSHLPQECGTKRRDKCRQQRSWGKRVNGCAWKKRCLRLKASVNHGVTKSCRGAGDRGLLWRYVVEKHKPNHQSARKFGIESLLNIIIIVSPWQKCLCLIYKRIHLLSEMKFRRNVCVYLNESFLHRCSCHRLRVTTASLKIV